MAIIMGSGYSRQEQQDVFLYQSNISPNQYEYSLRFRDEIIDPKSNHILRTWEYVPSMQDVIVVKSPPKRRERTATGYESNVPAGASNNPSAPFNEAEMVTCPHCNGDKIETSDPNSNCCGAQFTYPGYPDSDVCGDCKEHAALANCHLCEGEGEVFPEVYAEYKATQEFDQQANQ